MSAASSNVRSAATEQVGVPRATTPMIWPAASWTVLLCAMESFTLSSTRSGGRLTVSAAWAGDRACLHRSEYGNGTGVPILGAKRSLTHRKTRQSVDVFLPILVCHKTQRNPAVAYSLPEWLVGDAGGLQPRFAGASTGQVGSVMADACGDPAMAIDHKELIDRRDRALMLLGLSLGAAPAKLAALRRRGRHRHPDLAGSAVLVGSPTDWGLPAVGLMGPIIMTTLIIAITLIGLLHEDQDSHDRMP